MVVEYSLVVLGLGLAYGLLKTFAPDFPLSEETFNIFMLYVLAKLGVEVVGQKVRTFLTKRMPFLFAKKAKK